MQNGFLARCIAAYVLTMMMVGLWIGRLLINPLIAFLLRKDRFARLSSLTTLLLVIVSSIDAGLFIDHLLAYTIFTGGCFIILIVVWLEAVSTGTSMPLEKQYELSTLELQLHRKYRFWLYQPQRVETATSILLLLLYLSLPAALACLYNRYFFHFAILVIFFCLTGSFMMRLGPQHWMKERWVPRGDNWLFIPNEAGLSGYTLDFDGVQINLLRSLRNTIHGEEADTPLMEFLKEAIRLREKSQRAERALETGVNAFFGLGHD